MRKTLLFSTILFMSSYAFSQGYTAAEMQEDLRQLKASIIEYNPGLYRFNPNFDSKVDSLISSIEDNYNKYQSYTLISQLCSFSNEGHFEIGQWTDNVRSEILNDMKPFLPFSVSIVDKETYVFGDYSNEASLSQGDKIVSINGNSSSEIIRRLQSVTPSDGDILTYQFRRIEDNFPWFYYFYIEQVDSFELVVLREGEQVKIQVEALTKSERQANAASKSEGKAPEQSINDVFELNLEMDYAYLHLKSFDWRLVEKYELKAEDLYSEIFGKINDHEAQYLILDLRGNTGGRKSFGEQIVSFIRTENEVPFLIRNTSWKGKTKTVKKVKSSKRPFEGTIYVLVDGYTYSVGGVIARYLRELNGATIIGEETGTRYEGFVAGSARYTTLPNSGIRVGVPCYLKEFPPSTTQQTKNRGLIPDHEISATIEDVLNDRDPVMEFAIKLASKK